MDRTRIRWRNVGRLAAGLGTGGLLLAVVPALLEPPAPIPLPSDVGLNSGATGAFAIAAARDERANHPAISDRAGRVARGPAHPAGPPRNGFRDQPRPAHDRSEAGDATAPPDSSGSPAPATPAPAASAPGPVPVTAPSPVAVAPIPSPPPPQPTTPDGSSGQSGPRADQPPPNVPSQFGFEH